MVSATTILSVVQGFFLVVKLFVDVSIIVLALTRVRRNRPDASTWLALSGAVQLLALFVSTAGSFVPRFVSASTGSTEAMVGALAGINGLTSTISLFGWIFLIVALLRLSDDPEGPRGLP